MNSKFHHERFGSSRVSQSLGSDRCQTLLFKSALEHFNDVHNFAALIIASKSFQNSSFGANLLVNFQLDKEVIQLFAALLSPSSCLSLQFAPSLHLTNAFVSLQVHGALTSLVAELVETKYFHLQLQSLSAEGVTQHAVRSAFASGEPFPNLRSLTLLRATEHDDDAALICRAAVHITDLTLISGPVWNHSGLSDIGLGFVSRLSSLVRLNVQGCDAITNRGLEHISKLSNLTELNIAVLPKITDAGLGPLSKLSNLTKLELFASHHIEGGGLEHIAKLSRLADLNLGICPISDAGVEFLSTCTSITSLNLACDRCITDAGLQNVAKLANITFLDVQGCEEMTDVGLGHICKALSMLKTLNLGGSNQITDAGLEHLSKLLHIQWLNFASNKTLTSACVRHLHGLSTLTFVNFSFCDEVNFGEIDKLKAALPQAVIEKQVRDLEDYYD